MFENGWKSFVSGLALGVFLLFSVPGVGFAKSYRATLHQWTRSKQYFDTTNMKPKVVWHATYFSPQFREAFIKRVEKLKYLEGEAAVRFVEKEQLRQDAGHDFIIAMYAPKEYRRFSLGKDSFWELLLTTEGGEVLRPISIEQTDITPYEKKLYSYIDPWSKLYRVVFPKKALGKNFTLTLRSVVGETHLRWK